MGDYPQDIGLGMTAVMTSLTADQVDPERWRARMVDVGLDPAQLGLEDDWAMLDEDRPEGCPPRLLTTPLVELMAVQPGNGVCLTAMGGSGVPGSNPAERFWLAQVATFNRRLALTAAKYALGQAIDGTVEYGKPITSVFESVDFDSAGEEVIRRASYAILKGAYGLVLARGTDPDRVIKADDSGGIHLNQPLPTWARVAATLKPMVYHPGAK